MTALTASTLRRLQRLPQLPTTWEGDRRLLDAVAIAEFQQSPHLVVWADAGEAVVRATELISPEAGHEALVRCLVAAMEQPHSRLPPGRPRKVVVRDRQAQLFLRGALQQLGIAVEYAPQLPLVDDVFADLQQFLSSRRPSLPPQMRDRLVRLAGTLWSEGPWRYLADHQVLKLELSGWEPQVLHIVVLGMLGQEFGLLLYRSLDSLVQFRRQLVQELTFPERREAYLQQDCLFLTFETSSGEDEPAPSVALLPGVPQPEFGQLHPLEGARPFLGDEEAQTMVLALEALCRFLVRHRSALVGRRFPALNGRYRVSLEGKEAVTVRVSTETQLAEQLQQMSSLGLSGSLPLRLSHDLLPEGAIYSIGVLPWDVVTHLQNDIVQPSGSDGLPAIMIQTSRPKARQLIEQLRQAGGAIGLGFNPGFDPLTGRRYDLVVLRTGNGQLHLFGEFEQNDPNHMRARKLWNSRCRRAAGRCALVIAQGVTGASRGNPDLKDMLALFEMPNLSAAEFGLGVLNLVAE